MADEMKVVDKLRKLAGDMNQTPLWMSLRLDREGDYGGRSNAIRLTKTLNDLADQIEREHAEELAAEKRDMTDEAREAVERLRAIDVDEVTKEHDCWYSLIEALDTNSSLFQRQPTWQDDMLLTRNRLIELIEHGGKQDVDVAALRELADEIEHATSCDQVECAYFGIDGESCDGCPAKYYDCTTAALENISELIRKAVEGAPNPDAESDSERACAALLDWRDQVAGLLGIDCGSMADEVQDAIMAELDKRLMPPGMEWPRFEDGERVDIGDEFAWAGNAYECDAVKLGDGFALHCDEAPSSWYGYSFTDSVKRPEPEVLGADKLPIKVGETVWDSTSPNDPTSSTVWRHGGPLKVLRRNGVRAGFVICENDQGIPLDCYAAELTHAAPDTQARIDDDATSDPATYCDEVLGWDAEKIVHHSDYAAQNEAMIADLLRRQRDLDAKTMGGE